eukprot:CAMPEP_0113470216 /NCGR_PEP_ID=MMETSP0014_2-20120614/16322_1 /TAXON_ID=2857 /ORGANISM="Nitzschia sp." /LENGTH=856 /DNA_ID=CAMNT_0000362761 /DNA_START=990 /DNA_END=3556 /DNA_ORIENTATION=- /assembly_acc=CAM_ASM_000159
MTSTVDSSSPEVHPQEGNRSTPPPPGFIPTSTSNGGERTRSPSSSSAGGGGGDINQATLPSAADAINRHQQSGFLWPGQGDAGPDPADIEAERTSSFSKLAAALGSGLAESMEDATRGEAHLHGGVGGGTTTAGAAAVGTARSAPGTPSAPGSGGLGAAGLTDNFFSSSNQNDLAYERHKRHMNSRLVGSSAVSRDPFTGNSHTSPEAGNLFRNSVAGGGGDEQRLSSDFSPDAAAFRPSSSAYHGGAGSGGPANTNKSGLPVTKDLGLTVMEPSEVSYGGARGFPTPNMGNFGLGNVAKAHHDGTYGIQRDMQNLWSDPRRGRSVSPKPPTPSDRLSDFAEGNTADSANGGYPTASKSNSIFDAEEELRPFTWDTNHHEPSRALAILRAVGVSPTEVRTLCESFGVVENFRSEFMDRGVVFVSFCDMRCAQFAAMQLSSRLQRLGPGSEGVIVKFCVPLNSSSQNDESLVVINDLPAQISVDNLAQMLSSFGAIRSLRNLGGNYGGVSYVVEFHDVQDSRQVVLELESTQPWGPNVSVEVGSRNPSDRKKGRELLALVGRWRGQAGASPGNRTRPMDGGGMYRPPVDPRYERGMPAGEPSQLVLGPDGRYTYANPYMQGGGGNYPQYSGGGSMPSPRHPADRYGGHGGHGGYIPQGGRGPPPPQQQQYYHQGHQQPRNFPSGGSVGGGSHHSGRYYGDDRSIGSNQRSLPSHVGSLAPSTSDGQNQHLMLDLDAVENGMDNRTSLMVRNIPNKYTQQMLLSEFTENGHGPGTIDFFYLPIDFKNRCNRGYAFINFVDYRDILMFHRQYYGKHWRTFNSDKICDITYARIQGKAAMLKRFENSALMEKDDEYKPLV